MFIVAPLSNCASEAKRDRFLEYISKIAPVTHSNEPKCHAYAWFRSAEDNDTVPHHWLRGLEVYENVEANTVTHRASAEYKAFRAAVGEEALLDRPSDLRFWRPSSVGFLTHDHKLVSFMTSTGTNQYIVVDELTPLAGKKGQVLEQLRRLAQDAKQIDQVLSFWVLHRGDGEQDESLLVFARYEGKAEWANFENQSKKTWKEVYELSGEQRRTTWIESGLGFLGR
ncbi:hypothetical protein N7510_009747 [Penicillium lagena]|uniref:uncharacterized protein n=1 Tax=Penicillium lagena TaxID=94218 RepID=UPI00253F7CA9|nr:uncharacterized protein N7510_009747 [Penicillium lagena]KAJ5604593.1 hypothetical protein N7510_009747 [Penicillium lagena]